MITYKYKVGDKVRFRENLINPTCGLLKLRGQEVEISGLAPVYNNKPCYYINGDFSTVYYERLFAGLSSEAPKFALYREESSGVYTLQGEETKRDMGDSGESDDKAEYRELYLKALEKTYGKVPFETETVEVGSLLEFTEAVIKATKEI